MPKGGDNVSSLLFMTAEFHTRLRKIRRRLSDSDSDALVVTHVPNIYYLCGFIGSAGVLVVEANRATLFTDGRYRTQAREQVRGSGVKVEIPQGPILHAVGVHLGRRRMLAGFEPGALTVAAKAQLTRAAGRKVSWRAASGWVEGLRAIKSAAEIVQMRAAARLICRVFEEVIELIRPGLTELDIAAEMDFRMRKQGAEGPSFETIVASGPRAALPHARPTAKRLSRNELVVLDAGAILTGYCSDMTRTVCVGKATRQVKSWYSAVLEAQKAGCEAVSDGVEAGAPDAAARRVLDGYVLGRYFVHSTGHGLGLEVHETPRLAKGQTQRLEAGMVVTIEPGVYFPGVGGIRIEDDLAIFEDKTERLTTAPRELLEL